MHVVGCGGTSEFNYENGMCVYNNLPDCVVVCTRVHVYAVYVQRVT